MAIVGTWFLLTGKRFLKKGSFVVLLILLPAAAWLLHTAQQNSSNEIRIAVYVAAEADNELGVQMLDTLRAEESEMFTFYVCPNEQKLKEDVAARKAECGYIILPGLKEKLDTKSFKRSIEVYSAPSTVLSRLTTEIVFASLAENYNRFLLADYVAYTELFDAVALPETAARQSLAEQAETLYEKWRLSGETFHFEFIYQNRAASDGGSKTSTVFPIRGLIAVYLFVIGMYSAIINRRDWDKGIFQPLPYRYRYLCAFACLAAPVMLAGVSAFTALWSGRSLGTGSLELAALLGYLLIICLFSWLLGHYLPGTQVLSSLIPFFIIGSLIFCPVFIDVGTLFPALKPVGRLFIPYYYLQLFG